MFEPGQTLHYSAPNRQNAVAIWAMIVGILTPVSACLFTPLCLFTGIAALVLGNAALHNIHRDPALGGRGPALAAITLGIIGIFMGVLGIGVVIFLLLNVKS